MFTPLRSHILNWVENILAIFRSNTTESDLASRKNVH